MILPSETSVRKKRYSLCKCFCGNEFITQTTKLNQGRIKSCGCKKIKHSLSSHRLYDVWYQMIQRCNNKNNKSYINYGARGITVCDRWLSVENFIDDMYPSFKEGLSLDRKDNNKGYSPDNCKWEISTIQAVNKRLLRKNNTSGYKGVSYKKNRNKYTVGITANNIYTYLGCFETAIDGAKAYDKYIIENNLPHTRNFND